MPKKWAEVAQSREFLALDPDQRKEAREQYFQNVIQPQIREPKDIYGVKQQFETETQPDIEFGKEMVPPGFNALKKAVSVALPLNSLGVIGKSVNKEPVSGAQMAGALTDVGLSVLPWMKGGAVGRAALAGNLAGGASAGAMEAAGIKNPAITIPGTMIPAALAGHFTAPKEVGS